MRPPPDWAYRVGGGRCILGEIYLAVIVAVIAMRMVQLTIDQVIDVIAMRHRLVPATWPMMVIAVMTGAGRRYRLMRSTGRVFQPVFIDMALMRMMQMPFMQVIDMAVMANRGMTAARTVDMRMIFMRDMVMLHVGILRAHGSSWLDMLTVRCRDVIKRPDSYETKQA